jgi:uncharacterized protein (TIRG00374 family)
MIKTGVASRLVRPAESSGWGIRGSRLRSALIFSLTVVVFYLLFRKIDLGQVVALLGNIPPLTWLLATALTLSFPVMSAVRWNLILRTMGHNLPLSKCMMVTVGVWPLSAISPMKAGDLLRAFALRREMRVIVATGSVLTERALDLLILAGFALAGGLLCQDERIVLIAAGVFLTVFTAFVLARLHLRWPVGDRLQAKIQDICQSIRVVGNDGLRLTAILMLTAARWFAAILLTKLLFHGVGATVTLGFTTAALPIAIFIGLLPVTFGGMGTRDTAMVILFATFATAPQALAVGLLFSLFGHWLLAVLGLPFMKRALA